MQEMVHMGESGPKATGRRCHVECAAPLLIPGSALCCLTCSEIICMRPVQSVLSFFCVKGVI